MLKILDTMTLKVWFAAIWCLVMLIAVGYVLWKVLPVLMVVLMFVAGISGLAMLTVWALSTVFLFIEENFIK